MSRRIVRALLPVALTVPLLTVTVTGCTTPRQDCEAKGGTWYTRWVPAFGGQPARYEGHCMPSFKRKPKKPSPTITVTGYPAPGAVVTVRRGSTHVVVKVREDGSRRDRDATIPATVGTQCVTGARWPDCVRGARP